MRTSEQPRLETLKGRAKTAAEADELTKQEQEVIDRGDTCRCALMAITPDGEESIMNVCLDTGSEADCVSEKLAMHQTPQHGLWLGQERWSNPVGERI